jgi:A/G-specific adenine glycosylase
MSQPEFSDKLLAWFKLSGRKDLPWQQNRDPYRIWLSEIMLQQTQVKTVIPYFEKFVAHFPDIASLASAELDQVLHLWTGLGYYARARNLHKTAAIIADLHDGHFPEDIATVNALPGIGRSTAGAILSLAFNQHHPILDGNVKRVLARYYAIPGWPGNKKVENLLWEKATVNTPSKHVAQYTQAIMDLGATVCTRSQPACEQCPVLKKCCAQKQNRQSDYPGSRPRKALPEKQVAMAMIKNEHNEVLLLQRPPSGIWGGLWCFPEMDLGKNKTAKSQKQLQHWLEQSLGIEASAHPAWPKMKHSFTHFNLTITPVPARLLREQPAIMENPGAVWYNPCEPDQRGLAAPVKKLLNKLGEQ